MPGGLTFVAGSLAVAGLLAAAGPVLIHLLNRRRHRVLEWAAMDFLRQALGRDRRLIRLRDLALLILRTTCVLLFGLAMARPYWSRDRAALDQNGPVHAVLIVDNSLSMGYTRLDGTLLDAARAKARAFIDQLPAGSRCTVLPLCGGEREFSLAAAPTLDDARAVLAAIEVVDRGGHAATAIALAREACRQTAEPSAKRIVLLGDQQAIHWRSDAVLAATDLPGLQVTQVSADSADNTWVAELAVRDRPADAQTPTTVLASIRHQGAAPRKDVQVSLSVDGRAIASQTIDLAPGESRLVRFEHRFDPPPTTGQVRQAIVEVALPPDRLPGDDRRWLALPVASRLPVVFIDQYGEGESLAANRLGETFRLRRLLAPTDAPGEAAPQLIQPRLATIHQVERELLADARLVVLAGVEQPGNALETLREYVLQGGQLLIAAGGEFDPLAWNRTAWLDGGGILPCPLDGRYLGRLPAQQAGELHPFHLEPTSLTSEFLLLPDVDREELDDLYRLPYFFRAIVAKVDAPPLDEQISAGTARIQRQQELISQSDARLAAWDQAELEGTLTEPQFTQREAERDRRRRLEPDWLAWTPPGDDGATRSSASEQARAELPRVLARYDHGAPFLVERDIGRGRVVLMTTGIDAQWNTLATTNAVLLLDRICREMIDRTLEERNIADADQFTLPVADHERGWEYFLRRPGGDVADALAVDALAVDALGADALGGDALGSDRAGVTARGLTRRGVYWIEARQPPDDLPAGRSATSWQVPLVANGPAEESDLTVLDEAAWRSLVGDAPWSWIGPEGMPTIDGATTGGRDLWKWPMAAVLLLLLVELAVLAWAGRSLGRRPGARLPARAEGGAA
jgi:hypothetical protein